MLGPNEGAVVEIGRDGNTAHVIVITAARAYHLRLYTTSSGTTDERVGSCSAKAALKLFPEARSEPLSKIWHREPKLRLFIERLVPSASLLETVPPGRLFVRPLSVPDRRTEMIIRYDPGWEVYEAGESFPAYLLQDPGAQFLDDAEASVIECIGHETPSLANESRIRWKKTRIYNNGGKQKREAINEEQPNG